MREERGNAEQGAREAALWNPFCVIVGEIISTGLIKPQKQEASRKNILAEHPTENVSMGFAFKMQEVACRGPSPDCRPTGSVLENRSQRQTLHIKSCGRVVWSATVTVMANTPPQSLTGCGRKAERQAQLQSPPCCRLVSFELTQFQRSATSTCINSPSGG